MTAPFDPAMHCLRNVFARRGRTFHHHSHAVGLNDGDRCFRRDEFALSHNVNDVIGEACLAARTQIRKRVPHIPGVTARALANSRGTPASDGPGGFVVMRAKRR